MVLPSLAEAPWDWSGGWLPNLGSTLSCNFRRCAPFRHVSLNFFIGDDMQKLLKTGTIALAVTVVVACSGTAPIVAKPAAVPAALQVTDNEKMAFTLSATGTQNYECKATASGAYAWAFVAPEAELFGRDKEKMGTHGAGPFWMALDGSKTIGTVKARADAPRSADIPWLLLTMKSTGTPGKMAPITSIQRINTVGGIAATEGCTSSADAGKTSKQFYTADYAFFVSK
jgi:Protein of unknown function (DUF3455)